MRFENSELMNLNVKFHKAQLEHGAYLLGSDLSDTPKVFIVAGSVGKNGGNYKLEHGQTYTIDGGQTFKVHGIDDGKNHKDQKVED